MLRNPLADIAVSHDSCISFHVQLHNQLRHLILSGRWAGGMRVPSENQLTNHLGISRTTVRLALQMAEVEGLVKRVRGRGTYVSYDARAATRLIAFVATDLSTDYQLLILKGIESQARASNYRVIFTNAFDNDDELYVLRALQDDEVAGILLWPRPSASLGENQKRYKDLKLPTVLLDRTISGLDFVCVTSDNYGGARQLVKHMIDLGHRRIVFLCHKQMHLLPITERLRAYQDVMKQAGLAPLDPWLIGEEHEEIDSQHILNAYDESDMPLITQIQAYITQIQPTAIFAANDHIAVLAVRALRLLGLQIPDDISVAGFDDSDLTVFMDVPLTTVAQSTIEIGKRAAQLLIAQIENHISPADHFFVPTQLRVRESTAVPLVAQRLERR